MFDIFVKSLFAAGRYLRRDHAFFPAPASVALLATAARFTSRIAFAFAIAIAASISGFAGDFTFSLARRALLVFAISSPRRQLSSYLRQMQ